MRRLAAAVLSCVLAAGAQQPQSGEAPVFRSSSQLVVEVVAVTDKNGKPIEGLKAEDFAVTENGIPQTIRLCEFQKLDERPARDARRYDRVRRRRAAHFRPDRARKARRNPLPQPPPAGALLRHDRHAGPRPVARARRGPEVRRTPRSPPPTWWPSWSSATERSRCARTSPMTATNCARPSTRSSRRRKGSMKMTTTARMRPSARTTAEFNIFNTDRQLSALQTAVNMLGRLTEKKVADLLRQRAAAQRRG